MKKVISFFTVLIGLVVVITWSGSSDSLTVPDPKWQAEYPQLYNNTGFARLMASSPTRLMDLTKAQRELIGPITNQFAIRDDILKYILDNIPESNIQARIAAIKMAQFDQAEIGVNDPNDMNLIANKGFTAVSCMNLSAIDSYNFGKGYDKLLRNTPERKREQYRIEKLLSGRVISADYGIQSFNRREKCNYFLGVNQK